jgi:hypothetical protein
MHRTVESVDYTGLPADHVAKFAEARYLKAWLVTVKYDLWMGTWFLEWMGTEPTFFTKKL